MPVYALHDFNDAGTAAMDSAVGNGAENGIYLNGAAASDGQAVLDGVNDFVKIYPDQSFQMDRGTLNIEFTLANSPLTGLQTVVSRDSAGTTDGGYHVDILADGSVVVSHETATGTQTFGTAPGFAAPGDTVHLTYSWDQGGTGGSLQIDNQTSGAAFDQQVPNTLTMDQGDISQPWVIGAGQSNSTPAQLNNIDQQFEGTVAMFSLSDTVDNCHNGDTPDAQPDAATTTEGDLVVIPVLNNDTDPNGDPLMVTGGSAPNGSVTVNADGTISYTPNAGFTGTDTITYAISDPSGLTDTSFVSVTVVPDNCGPDGIVRGTGGDDLIDASYIDPFDTDRVDANDAILPGDAPNDDRIRAGSGDDTVLAGLGDDLVVADRGDDVVQAGQGDDTVSGGRGDDLLNGEAGDDSLIGGAGSDSLYGGNDDDTVDGDAGNDVIDGGQGADALVGGADRDSFVNVGAGDRVDGSATGDDYDTLDLRGLGPLRVDYDPANAENGTVTFLDGTGAPTGTLSFVEIENVLLDPNQPPTAGSDEATTPEDTAVTIPVLGNDSDPDGQPLTVVSATAPNGTVVINPNGTLTYTPNPDYNGPDTITYTVTDPDGATATSTVAVTVTPVNDAPVAEDDSSTTPYDTAITYAVLGNDSDPDGDALTILGTPISADGTVTVNSDGSLTFTPNPGFEGLAEIPYTIVDAEGLTDTAIWTVEVGIAPPPVPDGIVSGTPGGDTINLGYTGDPDGDRVDNGDAILPGDAPNDDQILAGDGNDIVLAGDGDDSVEGEAGNDSILGQDGNDTLSGGDGSDSIDGGDGDDLINTGGGGTGALPDLAFPGLYAADLDPLNDRDTVRGGDGNDTIFTGDDRDVIFGGAGNDSIDAGIDNDNVTGGAGDDTVIGFEGSDNLFGGAGDDLIYGGSAPGAADPISVRDDQGDPVPTNDRDLLEGGDGADTIYGFDDDDVLTGGAGDDVLDGGIDDDFIIGASGNDTIIGGQGADTMGGGDDRDVFIGGDAGDFVDGNEGGDDFDTLDLTGAGPLRVIFDPTNAENGTVEFLDAARAVTGTMSFQNIENVIPCFTPGTLIATPKGEVLVEDLKAGDRIITRDNGIQEIRWTGAKVMGHRDLFNNPHLKPVLIRQGSLGNGLPERDMTVSPNHRLLVANDRTALYFDEHEVLVAAKHLVASKGVSAVDSVGTTYIHFMFDRHEVVLSNGAWTESFQPGDYTLKGMGNAQRSEIFELFPELKTEAGLEGYQAARRTLKRHEALLLAR